MSAACRFRRLTTSVLLPLLVMQLTREQRWPPKPTLRPASWPPNSANRSGECGAADALGVDLPRAGLYRLIPPPLAERIRAVLKKAPALETKAAAAARMEGRRDE